MYTTFGAPSGAFTGSNGSQSGVESRMSTLTTPLNCLATGLLQFLMSERTTAGGTRIGAPENPGAPSVCLRDQRRIAIDRADPGVDRRVRPRAWRSRPLRRWSLQPGLPVGV